MSNRLVCSAGYDILKNPEKTRRIFAIGLHAVLTAPWEWRNTINCESTSPVSFGRRKCITCIFYTGECRSRSKGCGGFCSERGITATIDRRELTGSRLEEKEVPRECGCKYSMMKVQMKGKIIGWMDAVEAWLTCLRKETRGYVSEERDKLKRGILNVEVKEIH